MRAQKRAAQVDVHLPVPFRGRTNEPAYTAHVAKVLAEVRGLPIGEIASATTDNFLRLFAKVPAPCA